MENEKMTQNDEILKHMRENGSITPLEAIGFGCMRLASRISDLRRRGYNITSEWVVVKKRSGRTCRFKKYRLEETCDESVSV